jgi:hypothetical protein
MRHADVGDVAFAEIADLGDRFNEPLVQEAL